MLNMYGYFSHSPKIHLGFQKLVQTLETKEKKIFKNVQILEAKGNKILKNVKTKWMSMLDPLKNIMA